MGFTRATVLALLALAAAATPGTARQPRAVSRHPNAPILIGYAIGGQIWVVGAAYRPGRGGGWIGDEKAKSLFRPGTRFAAFDLSGARGAQTLRTVGPGEGYGGWAADATGTLTGKADAPAIALAGALAPPLPAGRVPRPQTLSGPGAAIYEQAAASLLRAKGLTVSRPRLTQHLRVDLNGDGTDEVLLCAHSRPELGREPGALRGDYALAALRFVSGPGGKVTTAPLGVEAYTRDSNEGPSASNRYTLLGCVDVDGDGRLEIALGTGYYEGWGVEFYSFDGRRVRRVLEAGWGA